MEIFSSENSQPLVSIGKYGAGIALSAITIQALARWLREYYIVPKYTVLKVIPNLGTPRARGKLPGQAVVCGGSVAGIFTAAVLSDHYEQVLIVEPEAWLTTEEGTNVNAPRQTRLTEDGVRDLVNKRTRVMQNTSFHGYLPVLTPIIQHLFPNADREMDELGLSQYVGETDFKIHVSGCLMPDRPHGKRSPLTTYITRDTFEKLLRRCLFNSRPNVRQVTGHLTSLGRSQSSSLDQVTYRTAEGTQRTEPAQLVVDATGPTQAGLKCLQRLGLSLPPSMRLQYTANLYYTTMTCVVPQDLQEKLPIPGGWKNNHFIYAFAPDPDIEPLAIMLSIFENSQLTMFCGGWDVETPARTIPEMKEIAKNLKCARPVPQYVVDIYDMLQERIDELDPSVVIKRLPPSAYTLYHQFAETAGFPSNFVAIGDAAMVVNPFFGQGCAKAGVGAATLDSLLRHLNPKDDVKFASKFFKAQTARTDAIWTMNKNADYGFKSTIPVEGETHSVGGFGRWFGKQLLRMAREDAVLCWTLWDIRWLLAPPSDLMTPTILARAVWTWLTDRS